MKDIIRKVACAICHLMGGPEVEAEPEPEPIILPSKVIDIALASSILLDKLEAMGMGDAEIYLPDRDIKVYNKEKVKGFLGLDETSEIVYVAEVMDCDDFAAELFGKFAGLVWTNLHALNWFIDDTEKFWFIEPQSDKIASDLEGWQGSRVRFFVGR